MASTNDNEILLSAADSSSGLFAPVLEHNESARAHAVGLAEVSGAAQADDRDEDDYDDDDDDEDEDEDDDEEEDDEFDSDDDDVDDNPD